MTKNPFSIPLMAIVYFTFSSMPVHAASFTYTYDLLSRLTNAAYSDGSGESYSYDAAGNRLSRVVLTATSLLDVTPPSVPTNLVSTAFVPSQLSIAWNGAFDTGGSGLAGYRIYVNGSLVTTTIGTNYSLSGLSPNTPYCLSIAAIDHDGNVSAQSVSFCTNTPVFQPPYLLPAAFANGHFQFGVTGGTPGPYNVWGSSNLVNWWLDGTLSLPLTNSYFTVPELNIVSPYYSRLGWRTNTP